MSRVTWDGEGKRFYETGVKNCVLYVMGDTGYKNGVAWNGITSISASPSGGEPSALYADDMKYAQLMSNEEYEGSISAYTYPDAFNECDGYAKAADGVYAGQQDRAVFGLCYKTTVGNDVKGNAKGYKLHIVWGCLATPSDREYQTINDSPDAIEFSWDFQTTPVITPNFKPISYLVIDSVTADPDKLAALENTLYGTDPAGSETGTEPTLPTPAAVIAAMTPTPAPGGNPT